VGLVGAGRIGAYHAALLRATPGVERLTVADADPERAERVAARTGAEVAADAERLVERGVEALVIAAATPAHAGLIHLAADAGLPCFCEKPIALDLETTDAVVDHVARAGTLLQMGFQRRFDPGYTAAREAVASGRLGRLYLVRLAGHDPAPPHEPYVPASGGIFRDLHIHDFDVVRWLTGREVVEVYADGSVLADEMFARHGDVDTSAAVLRLEDGPLAILSGARHDPLGYDIRTELFGSGDSIAVGAGPRTPLRSVEEGVAAPVDAYRNFVDRFDSAYRRELATFVALAADGGESPCTAEDARQALLIALAADRSRAERRPVRVEEVA
jgi:myo-inositol 2-dehydrogenase/D-chiro-inositol 1-dehydrogenase